MSIWNQIGRFVRRQARMRRVTQVASRHSRAMFPEDRPVWSMVAEEHPDACVVYVTYERDATVKQSLAHRFFKVKLPDLSVVDLQSEYYPAQWGPYH